MKRWVRRLIWGTMAALLGIGVAAPLSAAELVFFDSPYCLYCLRFEQEIGRYYHKTDEARVAPMRRVRSDLPRPEDLNDIHGIVYTPTFVLIDQGREIGRVVGYPGEEFFWAYLQRLIAKLK